MSDNRELASLDARASVRRGWLAVILGALSALAPLSIDMYLPALPRLAGDFQVSASFAQLSLTFCLLGLAFGQLIAGPLSDSRGRRGSLMMGMIAYTVASVLCAFTHSIVLLIFLRFLQGLAGAAGIVVARAVARDHFSGINLTNFFALLMLVNGAAPVLAPVVGAQILRFTTWHGVFVVLSALGVLIFLGVFFGLPESLPMAQRSTGGLRQTVINMRRLLSNSEFMGFVLTQSLIAAAMFAYISGSPFVLQRIYAVSPQTFSFIFGTNGIGIILAGQITARVARRLGEARVLKFGVFAAAIASILLLIALSAHLGLIAVLPPLFVVVSCVGIVGTVSTSLALHKQGQMAGSASALIGVCQMFLGAMMTPLVSVGGSHNPLPMAIVICACDLLAALCYWVLIRRHSMRARVSLTEGSQSF